MYDLVERPKEEMAVLGGDLNGHVGRESDEYEGIHRGVGFGMRNMEGERIWEFRRCNGDDCLWNTVQEG